MSVLTHAYAAVETVADALATRVAGRDCPLCGGGGRPWGEKQGAVLRECCGVLLSWQWPDEETYARFYSEGLRYPRDQQRLEGQGTLWERDGESLSAAESRLDLITARCPQGLSLLDIGCGTGALVAAARKRGILAVGMDPNAALVEQARHQGRPIRLGSWAEAQGTWSVVTLLDVLEHLTGPDPCLRKLRSHLLPGGTLVIEWPEWDCPAARAQGSEWRHIRPLQHLCLYNDAAARALFRDAGWSVRSVHRPLNGSLGKISYFLQPTR